MWDYYHKTWSTFLLTSPGVDATLWNGEFTYITADGRVLVEEDRYTDVTTTYSMKLRTAWIKLSSLQGYQRARRFAVLGDFKDDHRITVKIYYDYDSDTPVQTIKYNTPSTHKLGEPLQFRGHLQRQKCQSIMFEIEESLPEGTEQSMALNAISLELAVKAGAVKLPARKTL